jgi:hypothetical protein
MNPFKKVTATRISLEKVTAMKRLTLGQKL